MTIAPGAEVDANDILAIQSTANTGLVTAQGASTAASTAQSTADGAASAASTAQTTATAAAGSASSASLVANNALTIAQAAIPKAGATGLGPLALLTDPVNPLEVSTKQYVDSQRGIPGAVDVISYGAVDDGLKGYFGVTWTLNAFTIGIVTFNSLQITVANTGPGGVALVTFPNIQAANSSTPGPDWVGKPIAINGAGVAGGILVSTVARFYVDSATALLTLVLASAAPTTLNASVQSIACPCFLPNVVNKQIWVNNAGQPGGTAAGSANSTTQSTTQWKSTIVSYIDPFTVQVADAIKGPTQTAVFSSLICWGTNNTTAVITAGLACAAKGDKYLHFTGRALVGSTGLFCLFDWLPNNATGNAANGPVFNACTITAGMFWISHNNSETFTTTVALGTQGGGWMDDLHRKQAIPDTAVTAPAVRKSLFARKHWPNCVNKSTIVVLFCGDSWSSEDPTGGSDNSSVIPIMEEIQRQNPGKTFKFVNRGIGGSTWRSLWSQVPITINPFLPWITDNTHPWSFYLQTIPVPGLGNVTPDLIMILSQGNNDNSGARNSDIYAFLNMVSTWVATNGATPVDVMIGVGNWKTTDYGIATAAITESFNMGHEYGSSMVQGIARARNIGHLNYGPRTALVADGWSPDHLVLKYVPPIAQANNVTAAVPFSLRYRVRDFFVALQLIGSSGADVYGRMGTIEVRLSDVPTNRVCVCVDGANNLNVQVVAWGKAIPTNVAITSGTNTLTTSGQATFTGPSAAFVTGPPGYTVIPPAVAPFVITDINSCLLIPNRDYGGTDYRTVIVGFQGTNTVFVSTPNLMLTSGTADPCFKGGWMFIPLDALAQVDIIIPGAGEVNHPFYGANCLVTKITGYTNKNTVTLRDNATRTVTNATPVNMFVGRISTPFGYQLAWPAGSDAGPNPLLTVRKTGSRVRIGYALGSAIAGIAADPRGWLQRTNQNIFEAECEGVSTPFVPQVWVSSSIACSLAAPFMGVGERRYYKPNTTLRDLWGLLDASFSAQYSGDGSHPSLIYHQEVFRPVSGAQDYTL